jgi:hypothetical protein
MTAKQRHRAGTFDRWRGDDGMVRCHLRSEECRGRLQAAHYIAVQQMRTRWNQARYLERNDRLQMWADRNALYVELDDLIADPRNSLVLCELHHGRFDRLGLSIPPPPAVIEFCEDYGLEHLLPYPSTTKEETA